MHESIYWANIDTHIKKHRKNCTTCLEFQQTQPKEKVLHHDIPLRPWEVLVTDVFHFNNKNYLCIVDYHSEFPVIKRLEGLSTENLIPTAKVIFTECGIPCKLMSDTGTISFQIGSAAYTLRKQCHQYITIKVKGRLKPALNS